jgi:hypothetical protein
LSAAVMLLQSEFVDLNGNLMYLISIWPNWIWAALFGIFAAARASDIYVQCTNWYYPFMTSVLGIWLWSLMLASATIFTPVGGVDLMLSVPLLCETWILSRIIENRKEK